jgi:hypothetical protein
MGVYTAARPQTETTSPRSGIRRLTHSWWTLAVVLAMLAAAVAGLVVAAQLTAPATRTQTVYVVPNANEREGRVPIPVVPNANEREGRVPSFTPVVPNANEREGRVPAPIPRWYRTLTNAKDV